MSEIIDKPKLVGDHVFCSNNQPTFWNWIKRKGLDSKEIEKFNPKDKLKIILRWKWSTDIDASASECEETRRSILYNMAQMPPQDEGSKHWLKNALYVENETNKVKAYFGLISQAEFERIEHKESQ